jgi:hypothetical protein
MGGMRSLMPQWLQNLFDGWPMIKANLPTFFVILVLMLGGVWLVLNWAYGQVLANKDAQIQLQDRQLADYKEKLQGATPDQAKAQIDGLEARLRALEPRRLSDEQRRILIEAVRVPVGTQYAAAINSEGGCPDCPGYGAQFERALRAAGWAVYNGMIMGPAQRPSYGLAITVPDPANLPPAAASLKSAFQAAKIDFEVMAGSSGLPGMPPAVSLLITARP